MAYSVVLNLKNKKALVIGGEVVALRKTQKLWKEVLEIKVVAMEFSQEAEGFFREKQIPFEKRALRKEDFSGVDLVFNTAGKQGVRGKIQQARRHQKFWLNDGCFPGDSDFHLPATYKQGDLMLSVYTHGKSPALGKRFLKHFADCFGEDWESVLEVLGRERKKLMAEEPDEKRRKERLREMVEEIPEAMFQPGALLLEERKRMLKKIENRKELDPMKRVINIGSRDSKLALIQSEIIIESLKKHYPEYDYQIVKIKTKGDKILNKTLSKVGGKGLFVKEIQQAILSKKIDLAVHSMKDLPGETPEGLIIGAIPKREDPRDVLILRRAKNLQDLPTGGLIGSSSLRRQSQILKIRRDLSIKGIRGNVQTRLRKMEEEEMDGIILAAAGLNRLGLSFENSVHLNLEDFIPAVGQGALGCEIRREDQELKNMLKTIEDLPTTLAVQGERSFLKALNGGCHAPIACYGKIQEGELHLRGMVGQASGDLHLVETISGPMEEWEKLGLALAKALEARGARKLLKEEEEKEHASDRL